MIRTNSRSLELSLVSRIDELEDAALDLRNELHFAEAHELFQQALNLRRDADVTASEKTIEAMSNLAESHFCLGEIGKATDIYREAVVLSEKWFGFGHDSTADSYQGIANMLSYANESIEAELYMQSALAIVTDIYGRGHIRAVCILHDLGLLLLRADDYVRAEATLRDAIDLFETNGDADCTHVDTAKHTLAHVLYLKDDFEEAKQILAEVIKSREATLGSLHPDLALSLRMLGDVLAAEGDLCTAKPFLSRALAIDEMKLGSDHPHFANSLYWYAVFLHQKSENEEAHRLFNRVLKMLERSPDAINPSIEQVRARLGSLNVVFETSQAAFASDTDSYFKDQKNSHIGTWGAEYMH